MNWSKTQKDYGDEQQRTRGREPETKNKNMENTTESGYGEMLYIEPNENYRRNQMMSPVTEGRQTVGGNTSSRSPTGVRRSVITTVRDDLNERVDTAHLVEQRAIPTLAVTIPSRGNSDERAERSPKTINMLDTEKETEYNIRTVNARRSPKGPMYQTYTITQDQGNLALDQPMQYGSFIHGSDYNTYQLPNDSNLMITSMGGMGGGMSGMGAGEKSSGLQHTMNMRQGREQVPVMYKMSPNKNMDEFNSSGEKYDTQSQLNNLKNQMERNVNVEGEKSRRLKGDINQLEEIIKGKEGRETISNAEVKRLVKKLTKIYDPSKTKEGALINANQSIIVGTNDELFNDRYKVLQKMNKLSSILLAKEQQVERFTMPREEERRTFDRNTLDHSGTVKRDTNLKRTPQQKFLYVSLAMISSKGPNCEDRIMLRKMRFDKGGVVDLAQETRQSKKFNVHKIARKAPPTGTKMMRTNPKYREKAAKVVQGWWRELRDRYQRILKKIIFIQSFWRGRWVRKYMYDIIYLSLLYQSFCQRIQRALVQHVRPYVWEKFFEGKKSALEALERVMLKDPRWRCIKIKPYWETWKNILANYRNKNLKSRRLVNIRGLNDDKLYSLLRAFNKWRINTAFGKLIHKAKEDEISKRKFFGMVKLITGSERCAKRTGLRTVKPHLDMYLADILRQKAVSLFLRKHPKLKRIYLRNYFNKWREQVRKLNLKDFRNKIFNDRLFNMSSKLGRNFLRRYLLRWWRNLPKNTELDFYNGTNILEKAVWRVTYRDPLNCIKEKEELDAIKNYLQRQFGLKHKQIMNNWREYFHKWRYNAQKLKDDEIRNRLSFSLMNTLMTKRRNRILSNRFNHWRKVPKINMADIFERFRNLIKITELVVNRALQPARVHFWTQLKNARSPKSYKTALMRLMEKYINNERFMKRFYLHKWLFQAKNIEIYYLKCQLIKTLCGQDAIKARNKRLARALRLWYANARAHTVLENNAKNDELRDKLLGKKYTGRLLYSIKKNLEHHNEKDALRLALFKWRNNTILIREKEIASIKKAADRLKSHNTKTHGPDLVQNLSGKSILNRKTKALKSMPRQRAKGERFHLLRFFLRWKLRVRDLRNIDLRHFVKKKALYALMKGENKEGLVKAWFIWKNLGLKKQNLFPIVVGTEALKRWAIRSPYKYFRKRVDMMNLKIPHGMSLQGAMIRGRKNMAKSMCFRNFVLRPYWKNWRDQTRSFVVNDLKSDVFKRIVFRNSRINSKLMLRKAFNRWREVAQKLAALELKKSFYSRLMTNMYAKNAKIGLRRAYNKWYQNYRDYIKKLNDAGLACRRLRKHVTKPVIDKFKRVILLNDKYLRIKKRLIDSFRNNDLGNLAYCFSRWRNVVAKLRELRLKCIVLRNLATALDVKSEEYKKTRLHEALLRWRINAAPNKELDRLKRIREGTERLMKGGRMLHNRHILDGILFRSGNLKARQALFKFFSMIDPNFNKRLLYRAFKTWKDKVPDTERMKEKLRGMVNRGILKPMPHNVLVHEPEQELVEAMQAWDLLKHKNGKTINDFCRALLNIKRQMNILKRNIFLKKKLEDLDVTYRKRYLAAFRKWRRNVELEKANKNAETIQRFLSGKKGNAGKKRDRLQKGMDHLDKYVKLVVQKKIKKYSIWQFIKQAFIHALNKQKGLNGKTLRSYFNRWRNLLPLLRREDGATMIENNYRNLRSRRKVDRLRQLSQKMKYFVLRLFGKYLDKRKIAFNKWLLEVQRAKCNKNAKTIQDYLGKRLDNLLAKKAKEKIRKMCRMDVIKQIKDVIIKCSQISGDRGAKLYQTLEEIYIRRPFLKLCTGMKWIAKISMLKRIQPKILKALRNHFLPYSLRKWYKNTVEDRNRKIIRLQNWFRARMIIWRKKAELRRQFLIGKFLRKMTDDADLQLRIPFKLWQKRAKYDTLNQTATNIQKIWKGNTSRKNVERLLAQKRLKDLLRKGLKNQLAEKMKESDRLFAAPLRRNLKLIQGIDKRYSTNNLIDYANDVLRNMYLYRLTGKRAFCDHLSVLKYYFNLWKNNGKKINSAALKVQTAFRGLMAKKKKNMLLRIKDLLYSYVLKYAKTDAERKAAAFRKWQLRAQQVKCDENSKIIQDYIVPKLERLLNTKFTKWFTTRAPKLANGRLNKLAKCKKLKDTIYGMNMRAFLTRLRNKDKADRLKWFLIKKFKNLDEDLLKMYLRKYLNDWRRNAHKQTELLAKAALLIQNRFKGHLARLFLAKLKSRKARILRLLMKLVNDTELKKKVALHLWRANANAMKLNDASKVLQDFMDDLRKKKEALKAKKRRKRLNDGLDKIGQLKYVKRSAFTLWKDHVKKLLLSKLVEDLTNKRLNHLQHSMKKIQDKERDVLLNKLLKIPNASRLRILSKWFPIYRDNVKRLGEIEEAEELERNRRLQFEQARNKGILNRIEPILATLHFKNNNVLPKYFALWRKNNKQSKVLRAGNKIGRFVDDKLKDLHAKKNWHKLADNLNLLNKNYGALRLMKRIKFYKTLKNLPNLDKHVMRNGWDHFVSQVKKKAIANKVWLIFNNFERKKEILSLLYYFNKMKNTARTLKKRDIVIEKNVNMLDIIYKTNALKTLNSAILIKKLFNTIPKVRALDFFKKLKDRSLHNAKLVKMGENLVGTGDDLLGKNKASFLNKFYKLYIYKVLDKLFSRAKKDLNTNKLILGRRLVERLVTNLESKSGFNYTNQRKLKGQCPSSIFSFHARVSNPRTTILHSKPEKFIIPYFVNYLDGKIKGRKKDVLDALKAKTRDGKFVKTIDNIATNKLKAPKKEFLDKLQTKSENIAKQGPAQAKLFALLRRSWIKQFCISMLVPVKRFKSLYLIRLTNMHKEIARQRFIREVIRKWRFVSFSKKLARKKLELMYKSLHTSYLQMANDVFGEYDDINPSVLKEFERFASGMGMFNNEDYKICPELQFCEKREVKYQFAGNMIYKEEEYFEEQKKEITVLGENTDYYIDQDFEEGTVGKYQSSKGNMKVLPSSSTTGKDTSGKKKK